MIKKSQIKEVLLKYIVPLQKQYPDFYLGGSIALMLQKHIPFRDTKDIDIVSPAFFGDLHETKFPYKGMVTSKKTYRIREINTCLDFFHNPQAQYVVATFQGHNIKLSPVNEITYAKENKIWGPVYKKKQSELGKEISKIFNEAIIKPGNTGLKNKRLKATFYSSPTTNADHSTPGTQIGLLKIDKIPGTNKTPAKITYYNSKENYITFNLNADDEMLWTQAFKEQKIPYKITNSNKLRINNVSNYIDITKGSSIYINR
jgi:hypothetical protein